MMDKEKINKALIFCFIVFLINTNSYGQYQNIEFDHYTTNDGLSHGYVFSIIQDSKGFMWIGTANGLNRFDGLSFKTYLFNPNDTNSISSNEIDAFVEDSLGNFWIMTSRMLSVYNRNKDNFSRKLFRVNNKIYNDLFLVSCFIDSKGFFWVGARGAIFRFKFNNNPQIYESVIDAEMYILDEDDLGELNRSTTFSFIEDEKSNIWIASFSNKLFYFDNQQNKFIPQPIDHPETQNFSDKQKFLIKDRDGDFMVAIEWNGLLIWKRNENKFNLYKPNGTNTGPNDNIVFGLAENRDGFIWIGSRNKGGVNIFNKKTGKFNYYLFDEFNPYSLNSNSINCFYQDKTGSMWVGTGTSKGVNKYSPNKKKFYRYYSNPKNPDGLNFNNILCFEESKSGDIWIGTDGGGLNKLDRRTGKFLHYVNDPSNRNSLSSNAIISICEDHEGTLWLGTYNGGLVKMKDNKFYTYYPDPANPNSIAYRHIWYVLEDSKKNLWVATLTRGLELLDRKTNRFYHFTNKEGDSTSLCSNAILQLFEDSNNNLFITTYSGVSVINLNAYDFSEMPPDIKFWNLIHREGSKNCLSSYGVYCVAEDKEGNIWFGTMTTGIDKLDKSTGKFINYSTKDGLPGNSVNSILVDNNNNLWLATDKGLAKFNPETKEIRVFDRQDGLQNTSFHGWALKTKDGEMFFGGPDGFNSFYPDRLRYNKNVPPIVITGLKIFNKQLNIGEKINDNIILSNDISETRELVLTYKENYITFDFIALEYTIPEKNQYAYMMDGFDKDWIKCGTKHEATYTYLDPGEYTFRVRAANNDGTWNEKGASINVIILPPLWETWWFRIIAFLIVLSLLIGFYMMRVSTLNKQKLRLEKLVIERTHEIEEKSGILYKQTKELNESNILLEEQQQQIEEQNEMLMAQAENLSETNTLLEERHQIIEEQAEELSASNDKLTILNATKDKFFSIIAHDLKNPFNSIMGFCEILSLRYEKMDDKKRKHMVEVVYESSKNLFKLLENLLQWARSQTGNIKYEPEEFILNELIDTNISLLENLILEKNLEIKQNQESKVKIFADINMINTVIRNLISNAIKYTETGSISIDVFQDNDKTKLSIIDTGIGISNDKLDKIFDVMSSKSTHGTRGESGTGLGLIICKEFIERNGGSISVISEPGKGSTFYFTIPNKSSD